MKIPVAVASVATLLVVVSILAVPAVASGNEYLARTSDASQPQSAKSAAAPVSETSASPESGLAPLISAWGASGVLLLGGGAVAVAASVRKQRKTSA